MSSGEKLGDTLNIYDLLFICLTDIFDSKYGDFCGDFFHNDITKKKEVSMIRNYHNQTQTNTRHREEEPHNIYSNNTSVRH